jgi:mevalonate kinase
LAGEDIDWISGPAILCAINLRVSATVVALPPATDALILNSADPFSVEQRVPLAEIGRYQQHPMDYVHAAVKTLVRQGLALTPLHIAISSQLPPNAGLSSSAAVSLATLAALNVFFRLGLSDLDICALATQVESAELKTGAGQMDHYACGLGGLLYLNCQTVPPSSLEQYQLPSPLTILIADTMLRRHTSDVIRLKRQRYAQSEPAIMAYVKHTEETIAQMRDLLRQSELDLCELGKLVSLCHSYLKNYMLVSNDLLDSCVETCLRYGAIGSKLTGTGMGGCIFALIADSDISRVYHALAAYPVKRMVTSCSQRGLIVSEHTF